MVLLKGTNYDYSGQNSSKILEGSETGKTSLFIANTEGFANGDYVLINPGNEQSEIVKITADVANDTKLTITALKFNHLKNENVYRLPYNQMRFYESSSLTGTYSLIDNSTVELSYATNTTNFDHTLANANYYYKRTFYNESSLTESDISLSVAWVIDDEDLYITPEELRMYLQFDANDYPKPSDYRFFIKLAMTEVDLDLDSTNDGILMISTLLYGRYLVMKALASRAISKGYVQVNAEGRTITKAYQEFVLDSENSLQEYKEFLLRNGRREATSTNFMTDTALIDSLTRTDIINIMNGTSNAVDMQGTTLRSYFDSLRSSR